MQLESSVTLFDDNKVETRFAELQVTADGITAEVGRKVGNDEVISRINQSAESIQIQANKVNIEGATIFSTGRLSQNSLNNAYDANGAATSSVNALKTDLSSSSGTTVINGGHIETGTLSAGAVNANSGTFNTANIPNLNASKITAGTLSADRIGAGSLSVGKIDATSGTFNTANIPNLSATKITSDTINGARINAMGASGGARATLTSTGLDIYNSSNQKKASYGATQYIYGGNGTYPLISVDGTNARLMQSANNYANVNSSGMQIYQSGASVADFGASARVGQTSSNNIEISSESFEVNDADGFAQFSITPSSTATSHTTYKSFGSIGSGSTRKYSLPKNITSFQITVYPSSGSSTTSSLTIPAATAGATQSKTVGVATVTLKRLTANGQIELSIKATSASRGGTFNYAAPRRVANITAGGYDLCYTAGDYIPSYVWTGASFLMSSKTAIDVVLPINRPILAENVTVTDVTMTTRQGGNYTHGSSASDSANWTVSSAHITESGVRLTATNSTTTNAINNDVIGIYLTCSMTFS